MLSILFAFLLSPSSHAADGAFAESPLEKTPPAVFQFHLKQHSLDYLFPLSLDIDDKLPAEAAKKLRALPTPVENHGTVRDKVLIGDLLRALGLDLTQTLFVKIAGSPDILSIPLNQIDLLGLNWQDEKRLAVLRLSIPLKGGDAPTALGFIGKENPFKNGVLKAAVWSSTTPDAVSLKTCEYLRQLFPGEGTPKGKKAKPGKPCKTESADFSTEKIFHLLFSHSAKHADEASYAYYVRSNKGDAWLAGRRLDGEGQKKDPGPIFTGDILKGYDSVLVIGPQDDSLCGSMAFLKTGAVTHSPLICRMSDD